MSLMNLLAANRSVDGVAGEPSPFKAADAKKLVPDFGNDKRTVKNELAQVRAAAAADLFVAKPVPAETQSPVADVVVVAKQPSTQPTLRKLLFGKNAPGRPGDMAQTEMTLSGVKVMRNDLSDADLELVRKPATKENPFSGATPLPSVDMDPAQKKPGLIQKIIGRVRGQGRSSE